MAMLDKVKLALRYDGNALDAEVTDMIAAARQDLILSGILTSKANLDTDALITRSIVLYAKWNSDFDATEANRYQQAYMLLKHHLLLSSDYTVAPT